MVSKLLATIGFLAVEPAKWQFINVAAGERTPDIVRMIDSKYPDVPIIASGGSTPESIRETIRAGANAITYTPPTTKELFVDVMEQYREKY